MSDKQRLVVCIMGQECQNYIEMSLESVKDADKIIYIDGGSSKEFWRVFDKTCQRLDIKPDILHYFYDQDDKAMNGKQRNHYLDFVKLNYSDYYCLAIDADEVVDDFSKLREFVKTAKDGVYSVKMRHFIGNLGHEDAKEQIHTVLNRLFKVSEADKYPEFEHSVLIPKKDTYIFWTDCITIWHLGYVHGLFDIKKKYLNHLKKSNMHTPEQLKKWYIEHTFGGYPVNKVMVFEIPDIILKYFCFDPEEIYFSIHRTLELKHFIMSKNWVDYFKPKRVLDLGCGVGLFGYVFDYLGIEWQGLELSEYAVKSTPNKFKTKQGDIRDNHNFKDYDLVLVLDILEHLKEEDLDNTLSIIKNYGKNFVFSIPFLNEDANLYLDKTHKIFKDKNWWQDKIKKAGFEIIPTPQDWAYSHQLLIGELK